MASTNDKQSLIERLRNMILAQKNLLFKEFDKEMAIARHKFTELIEEAMSAKEEQMNAFKRELEMSNQPIDTHKFMQSDVVRSLLCLKYKRDGSATSGSLSSLGYIQICTAAPEDLHFVEDYRSWPFKKHDHNQVYYACQLGHDPCLVSFITVAVLDESNKELNVSNQDLMNGVYLMEFVIGKEGTYSVHVALYGQEIPGSPFRIVICDSAAHERKPQPLAWDQPEAGDGASQARQSPMRAATLETSGEVPQRCEMREDAPGRRPGQPPIRFATQATKQEVVPQRHEMPEDASRRSPELSHLAVSVNMPPNAVSPQEQSVCGFPTTVAGHPSTVFYKHYEPSERNISNEACPEIKAPCLQTSPKPAEVSSSKGSVTLNDFCSDECFESHERERALSRSSFSSSSAMRCSALPGESMPEVDSPKPNSKPVTKALKKGTFSAELMLEFEGFRRTKFSFPIGVTATAKDIIILTDTGLDRVLMFDAEARPLSLVSLPDSLGQFKRPSAVVALEDGTFAVKDDRCIYVFSKEGEFIRTLGKGNLSRPYGLALHKGENLLTLSLGDSTPTLRNFSLSGNFEQTVVYGPLVPSAPCGSKCRFMDVHNDRLFVSDLGLSCLYKTSLLGETVKTFGGMGKKPGLLNEPAGLSATEQCLFVGDSKNNRVQVFDFDGNYLSAVKMKSPVVRPSGLYVSPKGVLYIVNYLHGTVGIYQLTFQEEP